MLAECGELCGLGILSAEIVLILFVILINPFLN